MSTEPKHLKDQRAAINKDTIVCASFAARPSNFGTRFHNYLYQELDLNYLYKGFAVQDINGAVAGLKAFSFRGAAVSMPHKESVMPLLNEIDHTASVIGAVNTIVNTDGFLKGYNTDYIAVKTLLSPVPRESRVALIGAGGMAKAIATALSELGFRDVTVVARSREKGEALSNHLQFKWAGDFSAQAPFDLLINATPQGMAPDLDSLPCPPEFISNAKVVFDSVANPSETLFIRMARDQRKEVITGLQVVSLQAVEQFQLYTGIRVPDELVARAAEHARV